MTDSGQRSAAGNGGGAGWVVFAAMLLILGGSFKIIDALWAFKYDDDLSEGVQTVIFERDLAVWGWVWLVLGFGLIAAGFALLRGAEWARWVAMVVAAVAAFVSFTWIFYQPLWAILSVTISMLVFYALAVYGRPAWEGTGDG